MRRIPLVYVLLLLLVACVGYAWNSERQSKLKLEKEVASLHQAAAGVQRAKQASQVDEAAALKWLKSELNEFAWLIGKWRLESQEDFVPNWNLPGHPKVAFERHDVYTVGGVSDIEIRPVYDGTLRVTYTMFSLVEAELVQLPAEETIDWNEDSGLWTSTFGFACFVGSLGEEMANDAYSASGEYTLDQDGTDRWTGTIRYTESEELSLPNSSIVLHRVDSETIRIELKDRQEDKFKNVAARLRELDLTFKRVRE